MWRVCVEALPPSLNQWYSGVHWSKRKAVVDEWHGLFYAALLEAKVPRKLPTPLSLNVTEFCRGHQRDADNAVLAAKLFGDTLKQYKYIRDDGPTFITSIVLQTRKATKGEKAKTVILIHPVGQ